MKRIVPILLFLFCFSGFGQNRPLLYNVDDLPQSLLQNPGARIDFIRHFGVPFFSQIHLSAGSTGVTAYDVFADDGTDVNQRVRNVM
ncbi:MAG TPA: hypothetical protein VJ973_05015, partial [Christiangramia sp.]|nr:hypothetical protein [Christiangramia sp.]